MTRVRGYLAQASTASTETHPTPCCSANSGERPLGIRVYQTHGPFFSAAPYLFGMVKNSEPSHKCHSQEVVSQENSDNRGIEKHVCSMGEN
jgi:hypothetical protein